MVLYCPILSDLWISYLCLPYSYVGQCSDLWTPYLKSSSLLSCHSSSLSCYIWIPQKQLAFELLFYIVLYCLIYTTPQLSITTILTFRKMNYSIFGRFSRKMTLNYLRYVKILRFQVIGLIEIWCELLSSLLGFVQRYGIQNVNKIG